MMLICMNCSRRHTLSKTRICCAIKRKAKRIIGLMTWPGAIEQMELAVKAGDGDFYQISIAEARLKQLRAEQEDTKTK